MGRGWTERCWRAHPAGARLKPADRVRTPAGKYRRPPSNRLRRRHQGVALCLKPEPVANSAVEHDALHGDRPQCVEANRLDGRDRHVDLGRLAADQPSSPIAVPSRSRARRRGRCTRDRPARRVPARAHAGSDRRSWQGGYSSRGSSERLEASARAGSA